MKLFRLAPIIAALALFSACASVPERTDAPDAPKKYATGEKTEKAELERSPYRSESYGQFLKGMLAERNGDYPEAIKRYLLATTYDRAVVQAHKRAAVLSLRLGAIEDAKFAAKSALAIDPGYVECLEILGGIYTAQGMHIKAAEHYQTMVEVDPGVKEWGLNLAVSYIRAGEHKKSLAVLKKLTERFPDYDYGLYYTGRVYSHLKDWRNAKKTFEELIQKRSDFLKAYENLAWVSLLMGNRNGAIEAYKDYLKVHPNSERIAEELKILELAQENVGGEGDEKQKLLGRQPSDMDLTFREALSHWRLAEITGSPESFQKALDRFQLVRAANRGDKQVDFYIANIFERIGLLNEAIATWTRLLSVAAGRETRDINLKIAQLHERAGDLRQSLEHALAASDFSPDDPELRYFVGLLYNKLNEPQNAETWFKEAVELRPEEEKYYFYLGVVYEKMKVYKKCIESMKKAISLKPDHSNALNYLGYLYAEQNIHLKEAEEHLNKALELNPDNGYFIDSLGWIYYKQGRYKEALGRILAAIRNIPPDPTVLEHLGDVYTALDDKQAAIKAYERSLNTEPEDGRKLDREIIKQKLSSLREMEKKGKTQ